MKRVLALCALAFMITSCSFTLPGARGPRTESFWRHPMPRALFLCGGRHLVLDTEITWATKDMRETDGYITFPFTYQPRMTGNKKNDSIRGELLYRKGKEPRDLVVLIPGTGENISTEGSAEALAKHGYDSVRFRSGIDIFDEHLLDGKLALDEDELRDFIRIGKARIRNRVCDYVLTIDYFVNRMHYEHVGISGVSLGGIFAPLIAHQYPYTSSVLVMISGGDLAYILQNSTEGKIVSTKARLEDLFMGTPERMWSIMREELRDVDPLYLAENTDPARMRIIANFWDHAVPFRSAVALRDASREPPLEVVLFPPGHYGSVLLLWVPIIRWTPLGPCPLCIYYPRYGKVQDFNVDFFTETIPR